MNTLKIDNNILINTCSNFEKDSKDMQETFSNVKYVYFISGQNFSHVSSTLVRDIINYGGQYDHLLPFKLKS